MYDSSGTIGPGINVGRAPKSTGAAAAAVTSASATAMKWSENCMGELISKVAEKQGQVVPSGVSDGGAPFIDGQKHSMEKKKRFFMMTSMDSSRRMLLACIRQSITLLQGERVRLDEMEHDAEQGQRDDKKVGK